MSWASLEGVLEGFTISDNEVKFKTSEGEWHFHSEGECCASAFIHEPLSSKEELSGLIGMTIVEAREVNQGRDADSEERYNVRDVHHYILQCDKGSATLVLYVEHNGYYGGSLVGGKV